MQIIPTVLTNDFAEAEQRIKRLVEYTKWVQIDVIDGFFCPFKTFELELLNKLDVTKTILWDIHLMVKEPEKWLEKCLFVGASRVNGQVEMMSDRESFVAKAKDMGMEVGLAFDYGTKIENIPDETDYILLMGRKSGPGAIPFNLDVLKEVSPPVGGCHYGFSIDGGVNTNNIEAIEKAGIKIAYSGSGYFDLIKK